jgi:hypothetical protein
MSDETKEPTKWLSAQQVADRYGLTRNWVYHCKELMEIAKKFGKYLKFPLEGVLEYEQTRQHGRKHGPGATGYDLVELAKYQKKAIGDRAAGKPVWNYKTQKWETK